MVVLGGWVFLMSEVPLYVGEATPVSTLQGCLAHKNVPSPQTPQWGHAYGPLVEGDFLSARCPCRRLGWPRHAGVIDQVTGLEGSIRLRGLEASRPVTCVRREEGPVA